MSETALESIERRPNSSRRSAGADSPSRREWLATGAAGIAASLVHPNVGRSVGAAAAPAHRFKLALNTSTIRGQKKSLPEIVDLAARAGYDGIEPWINELEAYRRDGGDLGDLRKRIEDAGLEVVSAIGFPQWIVDDDSDRQAGLEQARHDMGLVRSIGGSRIAAPPVGARDTVIELDAVAERFASLVEVGRREGVEPQLELWGFSKTLSRLSELLYVAAESAATGFGVLLDVYHLYKGGSGFNGLSLVSGEAMHVFHVNDYPSTPPRSTIRDADRVYPGDGTAPLGDIFRTLSRTGFDGHLSLELFNPTYWSRDAETVCREGLERIESALASAADDVTDRGAGTSHQ